MFIKRALLCVEICPSQLASARAIMVLPVPGGPTSSTEPLRRNLYLRTISACCMCRRIERCRASISLSSPPICSKPSVGVSSKKRSVLSERSIFSKAIQTLRSHRT